MTSYCANNENTEMWIGDTGAMCHMKSSTEGMYELEKCDNIKIDTANGSTSSVTYTILFLHRHCIIKITSAGGSKYWFLAVDEATHMKFSLFLKQKSDVKDKFIPLLKELHDMYERRVQRIRCDNAGENQAFEKECIEKELGIVFEYTAPSTPQQNVS